MFLHIEIWTCNLAVLCKSKLLNGERPHGFVARRNRIKIVKYIQNDREETSVILFSSIYVLPEDGCTCYLCCSRGFFPVWDQKMHYFSIFPIHTGLWAWLSSKIILYLDAKLKRRCRTFPPSSSMRPSILMFSNSFQRLGFRFIKVRMINNKYFSICQGLLDYVVLRKNFSIK